MASTQPSAASLLSTPSTSILTSSTTAAPSTYNDSTLARNDEFVFPAYSTYPPFYTLQPNLATLSRQLSLWSALITSYCAHYRLFRLSLSSLPADLFHESSIRRSLVQNDIRKVLDWMSKPENGGRAEWIPATTKSTQSSTCYVYWKTPAEWADMIYAWVDETGQKGTVLTLYELRESDAVSGKEWHEMDEDLLKKVLHVLVKRGKGQIFGQEDTAGIKVF